MPASLSTDDCLTDEVSIGLSIAGQFPIGWSMAGTIKVFSSHARRHEEA